MVCRSRGTFMVRSLTFAVALALGTVSIPVHALGLGDIKTASALNQTFKGYIDLRSVGQDELADVRVKLADAKEFAKAGIERPFFLTLLKFRPERLKNGRAVIRVTSDFPIREPFLDFLVEVDWPKGHLIREYTVLLDPPVTTKRRAPQVQAAPAPARTTPAAPVRRAPRAVPPAPTGVGEYGPVSSNDTLWGIAKKLRPRGVTMEQMMVALLRANPDAFINGDMNRLRRGQVLRVPTSDEIGTISRAEAIRAYRDAQEQWLNRQSGQPAQAAVAPPVRREAANGKTSASGGPGAAEPQSELRIATARPEGEGEAGASEDRGDGETIEEIKRKLLIARENAESARIETEALRKEVGELRKRLEDMQRLLTLKDEQLAQLQARTGQVIEPGAEQEGVSDIESVMQQAEKAAEEKAAEEKAAEAAPETTQAPPPEEPVAEGPAGEIPAQGVGEAPESETIVVEGEEETPPAESAIDAELAAAADAVLDEGLTREGKPAAPPAPAAPVAAGEPAPEGGTGEAVPPAQPAPQEKAEAPAEIAVAPEEEKVPAPTTAPPATPVEGGFDIKRFIQDNLPAVAGVGGVLVLLLVLLGLKRKSGGKEEQPFEPEDLEPATAGAAAAGAAAAGGAAAAPERTAEDEDIAGITPDSDLSHDDETSFLSEFSPSDVNALRDETGEVDPVSEADVYIAYGRYQQAEDLLKQAMSRDPDRLALKHKLLEVFYATRNTEAFNDLAHSMVEGGQDIVDQDAWARAREMGRELDPHNALYAEEGGMPHAVAVGDVDGEASPDLDADIADIASDFDDGLDDLGEESSIDEPSLDLDDLRELEDLDQLDAETQPLDALESLDLDLPSAEVPGGEQGAQAREEVSSLDLPSLDLGEEGAAPAEEPVAADLQAQLDELSDLSSLEGDLSRLTEDLGEPSGLSGGERPSGLDEPIELDQAFDKGLDSDVDLDVDSLTPESVDAEAIETKLDLAKAFLEMGDSEGARDILEEIRQEGNDSQREEADKLLAEMT